MIYVLKARKLFAAENVGDRRNRSGIPRIPCFWLLPSDRLLPLLHSLLLLNMPLLQLLSLLLVPLLQLLRSSLVGVLLL